MTLLMRVGWLVGRFGAWLDALCCAHRDTRLRAREGRIWLECLACGWESRGWRVERKR